MKVIASRLKRRYHAERFQKRCLMSSDSFFKDLLRSSFLSFFRIIAVGFGIIAVIFAFSIVFKGPPSTPQNTTATVVPNHEWLQGPLSKTMPTIVKLNIDGHIGIEHLTEHDIRNQLIDTVDGDIKINQVKALLLYINTPGGNADTTDCIYRIILEYKKRYHVPVYAFVNGYCASGGMYIACTADKIYATDSSIIGHVGVLLGPIFNFSTLMDHLGIQSMTLTAGTGKDNLNPFRPWKPGEETSYQAITNVMYDQFVSIVSASRPKLTKEALAAQGAHIYAAVEAEQLGYIDGRINILEAMLEKISSELGIEKNYQVVEMTAKNWLENLFQAKLPKIDRQIEHKITVPGVSTALTHPEFAGKPL